MSGWVPGRDTSIAKIVGTAEKKVGRTRSTVAQKVDASKRSATNVEPPASSGDTTLIMIPLTWKSGSTSRQRVSVSIPNHLTIRSAVTLMFA